jgi:hypothetical protein
MGLRDLLRKKDEVAKSGPSEPQAVQQFTSPEFTFIRSDTHTQDFIHPPEAPPDSNYLSAGQQEPAKTSRRSLDVFRSSGSRSRNRSDSSPAGSNSSRRLSERLHLSRAPDSSEKVPQNLPDIVLPRDPQDKDAAESQWEARATMLASQNDRAVSRPSTPGSGGGAADGRGRGSMMRQGSGTGRSRSPSASQVVSSKAIDEDIQEAIRLHEEGDLPASTRLFGRLADPEGANNPLSQVLYGLALR